LQLRMVNNSLSNLKKDYSKHEYKKKGVR
jgi:hypothetical protein